MHSCSPLSQSEQNKSMMAPDADIYDYRALSGNGSGSYETITNAVNEAVTDGCDIINMTIPQS